MKITTHIEPELLAIAVSFRLGEAEANLATMSPRLGPLKPEDIPAPPNFGVDDDAPVASLLESSPASTVHGAQEEALEEALDDGTGVNSDVEVVKAIETQEQAEAAAVPEEPPRTEAEAPEEPPRAEGEAPDEPPRAEAEAPPRRA